MRRVVSIALAAAGVAAAWAARRPRSARDAARRLHPLDSLSATLPAVDDLTRDELYAWAKRLDIPRRSRMRKAELAEAIRVGGAGSRTLGKRRRARARSGRCGGRIGEGDQWRFA